MEIILKENIYNLGYKNDLVSVKDGYARNFLIPRGKAVIANASNKKMWEENMRQAAHKAAKLKQDAEAKAEQLTDKVFKVGAKVGERGKIFGKVTNIQLADAMKEEGFEVDRRKIKIPEDPKSLGAYQAQVELHKEVKPTIHFEVVEA